MDSDFWKPINLGEFNDRTGHAYRPADVFNVALEHWVERGGVLLGVIVLDRIYRDYGYVAFGRDEHHRFRAIEAARPHRSIEKARDALLSMMREILKTGASVFPQDCVQ